MPLTAHQLGYHRDHPDARDRTFVADASVIATLPASVDLSKTPYEPPIVDQRPLASCSAHAIGAMFAFVAAKEARPPVVPSRLFIYYNERRVEGTTATDSGAKIRDGIKTIAKLGVCHEDLWPYDAAQFAAQPTPPCYENALANQAIEYFRISGGLPDLKACLAAGYPFVFGMSIYSNFFTPETAQTGEGRMPGPSDVLLGGHAVTAVGYDDATQQFLLRNSTGTQWGMKGYFTLPYAFLESKHLANDFWTLRSVA